MSTNIRYPNRYATFWGAASNAMAPAGRTAAGDGGDTRTPALNIREGDTDYVVEADDVLIVIGHTEQVFKMKRLLGHDLEDPLSDANGSASPDRMPIQST